MVRILLIDDSPSALAHLERILTEAGHQVTACISATQAIRRAAQPALDLIVTDIYMPEKDGLEVIAAARRVCPTVPVIAVSAAVGTKNMLKAARFLGAAYTLQKPFSKEQLLQTVAQALAREEASK